MERLSRGALILRCADFAPLGWNTSQDPSNQTPEPHCCPGCHIEWDDRIIPPDRLLPMPGYQPSRWSRTEARVCCTLTKWLDTQGFLGEQFLTKAGDVTFRGETHPAANVRVYLATRTIDRNLLARLVWTARKRERGK